MKKVKLKIEYSVGLSKYLDECIIRTCIIDSETFADMLRWHLQDIKNKLQVKVLNFYQGRTKSITLKLSYVEIVTLSYVFKHVPIPPFLSSFEFCILSPI